MAKAKLRFEEVWKDTKKYAKSTKKYAGYENYRIQLNRRGMKNL